MIKDINILYEFESSLNEIKFSEAGIGRLIPGFLFLEFFYKNLNRSFADSVKDHVRFFKYKAKKENKTAVNIPPGLKYFIFNSPRRHLFDLIYEVYRRFDTNSVAAILKDGSLLSKFEENKKPEYAITYEEVLSFLSPDFNKEFENIEKILRKKIKDFTQRNNIKNYNQYIFNEIYINLRYFNASLNFFKTTMPSFVINECERYSYSSCFVAACNILKIKSYTVCHGIIGHHYIYTPVGSDKIFLWGEIQKEYLLNKKNTGDAKFLIAGVPHIKKIEPNKELQSKLDELKLKAGTKKIILFGTNNLIAFQNNLINTLESFINKNKDEYFVLLKLHPSEKINNYKKLEHTGSCVILTTNKYDYELSILAADFAFVFSSALGIDLLINNVPFCFFDAEDELLGQYSFIKKRFPFLFVKDESQTKQMVDSYFQNPEYKSKFDKVMSEVYEYNCKRTGSEAVDFIYNYLNT